MYSLVNVSVLSFFNLLLGNKDVNTHTLAQMVELAQVVAMLAMKLLVVTLASPLLGGF